MTPPLMLLLVAVPMWQDQMLGVPWSERLIRADEASQFIAEHGDDILFKGKHTAEAFNRLAEGLAIASMVPGGVVFAGMHFHHRVAIQAGDPFDRMTCRECREEM